MSMSAYDQERRANHHLKLQEQQVVLVRRALTAVEAVGLGTAMYLSHGRPQPQAFFGTLSFFWFMDLMFGFRKY